MPYICNFFNISMWLIESKHLDMSSRQAPVISPSFICSSQSSITRWRHVCVECLFEQANWSIELKLYGSKKSNLITHKAFHHLGYMPNNRYWPVIVFVIGVTIIFINREILAFFQSCLKTLNSRDLFIICANDSEIYGADSFSKTTSIPSTSFLGWELKYFSISLLDTLVKRKAWILFEPFQSKLSDIFWNLEFIFYRYWQNAD